jgi:NAD(P)-dependent dehydrogenase (short-subunit alcohol dehydrogenase family)
MVGRLAGRVALVTGASRGIGRAVARRFAAEGAEVIALARTQGALEDLDDEVSAAGVGKIVLAPQDLREFDRLDQMAAGIGQRFGRLDILVGCAGDLGDGLRPVPHGDPRHVGRAFDVNAIANWRLIRACDPLLRLSPAGRAIFVTDSVARQGLPYWGLYAAGKAALEALVLSWAAEVERVSALRINLIDPGPVATRLRAQAFPGENPALLRQPDQVTDPFVALAETACTRHGEIVGIE